MTPNEVLRWVALGFGGVAAAGFLLVASLFAYANHLKRRDEKASGSMSGDSGPGGASLDQGPGTKIAMTGLAT
jgi:hypothetical protein